MKKVIVSPLSRMASSQHGSKNDRKKSHCDSSSQMLVRVAVRMDQYFSTLFGMLTHWNMQADVRHANVGGPPDLRGVAH